MTDLKQAEAEVQAALQKLEAARQKHNEARAEALERIKADIEQFDFLKHELFAPVTRPAQYVGPNGEKWSGAGKTPNWLRALADAGHGIEQFRV